MIEAQGNVPIITPAELRQRLDSGDRPFLLDVREPFEWEISNLGPDGALLIPLAELPGRLAELDSARDIVVYCRTGARSDRAARYLLGRGYTGVWNLVGGINEWARTVDPGLATY